MQSYQVIAVLGFLSTGALATPTAKTLPSTPLLGVGGTTVSCQSGNVYCSDGSKTQCDKKTPGQTCSSGQVICCNSAATVLNLQLLPICGNSISLSVPVTVSAPITL